VRRRLCAMEAVEALEASWQPQLEAFRRLCRPYLLYDASP